jgi:serine/threonine protein phosphatase PrpC
MTSLLIPRYCARSDAGRVRGTNEDYVFAGQLDPPPGVDPRRVPPRHLLVVADGVGGFELGEWASQTAVETIATDLPAYLDGSLPAEALRLAVRSANERIWRAVDDSGEPHVSAVATTVVAVVLEADRLWWANVGDSRAYLLRDQRVRRLTRDHSWVDEQVRRGLLTPEQARLSERRNVITRGVGFKEHVEVDTDGPIDVLPHDIVVLCSDGLHGLVADEEIAATALKYLPDEAAERLVQLSNERGGIDNISVIVCGFVEAAATLDQPASRQG